MPRRHTHLGKRGDNGAILYTLLILRCLFDERDMEIVSCNVSMVRSICIAFISLPLAPLSPILLGGYRRCLLT